MSHHHWATLAKLLALGDSYQRERAWNKAFDVCEQMLDVCTTANDNVGRAHATAFIAKMMEVAGSTKEAKEYGRQAVVALEDLSPIEWTDACKNGHPLVTLDATEVSMKPEPALRYRIMTSRAWVRGVGFRAVLNRIRR